MFTDGSSIPIFDKRSQMTDYMSSEKMSPNGFYPNGRIDKEKHLYPHSLVWTPIPLLSWIFPFIGHMGICTTSGIIRDFAGPYHVSENRMAFGNPTKYWQMDLSKVPGGKDEWDRGVHEASEIYKGRMHNLLCDNCHSHVARALNEMKYKGSSSWNMVNVLFHFLLHCKYVSFTGFLKSWLPFLIIAAVTLTLILVFTLKDL